MKASPIKVQHSLDLLKGKLYNVYLCHWTY